MCAHSHGDILPQLLQLKGRRQVGEKHDETSPQTVMTIERITAYQHDDPENMQHIKSTTELGSLKLRCAFLF